MNPRTTVPGAVVQNSCHQAGPAPNRRATERRRDYLHAVAISVRCSEQLMCSMRSTLLLLISLLLARVIGAEPYQCSGDDAKSLVWLKHQRDNNHKVRCKFGLQGSRAPPSYTAAPGHETRNVQEPLLPVSTSYGAFILELKNVLDERMLPERAIKHLFSDMSPVHPACVGDWLVGVAACKLAIAVSWFTTTGYLQTK